MKLLVTGGAGYIGSVVTRLLLEAGHAVTIVDDLSTGHADTIPAGVEFHEMSVHDVASVLTPSSGYDGVLHFAAKIAAGESVLHPERFWHTNLLGSMRLLDAVRAARVPRFVFSSTACVYAEDDVPLTETAPTAPPNPYGTTKLAIDHMLTGEAIAHGLGAVSLRYFNAAGAHGAELGERHDPETHLIPIALDVAAGRRDKLALYGEDYPTADGTCVRDYIHVTDLAAAHLLALEAATVGEHKIFNLGNGNGYSNRQVIDVVREVTGRPVTVASAPRRDGDAVVVVAAADKARAELGWKPAKPDLYDIITDAWAFHQSR